MLNDVAFACWNIWKRRCERVYGKKEVNCIMIINRTRRVVNEFYHYNKGLVKENRSGNGRMMK